MKRIKTGISNLDLILEGGLPIYSVNIISGHPGTGKTILSQQIIFKNATPQNKALCLTTLSEPTMKMIRYQEGFSFFQPNKVGDSVFFTDIGLVIRKKGLDETINFIMEKVKEIEPSFITIDSFKAIHDLAQTEMEMRKFIYDLSVKLSSWKITTFLIGEYQEVEISTEPEFAIADGIIYLEHNLGTRNLRVLKMRGTGYMSGNHFYFIDKNGINLFPHKVEVKRKEIKEVSVKTGILELDQLLGGELPFNSVTLLSGITGVGKTILSSQFLYNGATMYNQKGIAFHYEEHPDEFYKKMRNFGWDFQRLEEEGKLKVVYTSFTDLNIDEHLSQVKELISRFEPVRVVFDSIPALMHQIGRDEYLVGNKIGELLNLLKGLGCTPILITRSNVDISEFKEDSLVDNIIILRDYKQEEKRKRSIEVYKTRGGRHVMGEHRMQITDQGIRLFYTSPVRIKREVLKTVSFSPLDGLLKKEFPFSTSWLVLGDTDIGKSIFVYQFLWQGLRKGESAIYIGTDEPIENTRENLGAFGFVTTPFERENRLILIDGFSPASDEHYYISDRTDMEEFIHIISSALSKVKKPCRVAFDSLASIAINYSKDEFVKLIYEKNRTLQQEDVVLMDSYLSQTLEKDELYNLTNTYDFRIDLYFGEEKAGVPKRYIRLKKVSGRAYDPRPFPYTIKVGEGIIVDKEFYKGG
ncbi:MAG: ATPase domain-containing protein [bacterium]|nr:ATPase domain-containing protein [bacterium]